MQLKLSDAITIFEREKEYLFCSEEKKITLLKNDFVKLKIEKLLEHRVINLDDIEEREWNRFCKVLYKNRFLIETTDMQEPVSEIDYCNYRYLSYRKKDAIGIQNDIKNRRILIVGVGGIGQVALQHLVASGFRKFEIVDFDVVKQSNFNRQFLVDGTQIEQKKTTAVCENLRKTYDDLEIGIHNISISDSRDFLDVFCNIEKIDMILCAADRPSNEIIRKIIVKKSIDDNIPCAFCGVGNLYGEVGPILVTTIAKEKYLENLESKKEALYSPILEGSICYTNSLVAILISYEIFKLFAERENLLVREKTLIYNLSAMKCIKERVWK